MKVPWSARTAAEIGADWLDAVLAPAAEFGRRARRAERAFVAGDEAAARAAIAAVARAARVVASETLDALRAAIGAAPDPAPSLARATAGDVLSDADFFELQRFLDAVASVRELAGAAAGALGAVPAGLDELSASLAPGRTPSRTFYLSGEFDEELARERGAAVAARAAFDTARSALEAQTARALGVDHLREGEFILMRERVGAGIPPGVRVVREAPTYVLCELALDDATLAALAESDAAEARVAACEEAVRLHLSSLVAQAAPRLTDACATLGVLDSFLARVRFAQTHATVEPEIGERGSAFAFESARFLPLAARLAVSGRGYEPISLTLERVAVVTGPNMGGKTAALRTSGFVAACVAFGVPVPAERVRLPLFAEIDWIGLAHGGEEKALLSAFGSELVEVRALLERPADAALVLIDEFARTTSPREGRALLVALLQTLLARGAHAFAATHLGGVAEAAGAAHYAIAGLRALPASGGSPLPLEAALALIAGAMDHRPAAGENGTVSSSDALALAGMLGLEPGFIARAERFL